MKNDHRGFTLVEVLFATAILVMAVGAALSVFLSLNRSMAGLSEAVHLNASTRLVQERILFDMRALTKVTQAAPQTLAGEFVEYGTGHTGTIVYSFANGQLVRQVSVAGAASQTTVVMTGLHTPATGGSASQFHYVNRAGIATTSPAEVRSIQFRITPAPSTRQAAGLVPGRNTAFSSALVQLRNVAG